MISATRRKSRQSLSVLLSNISLTSLRDFAHMTKPKPTERIKPAQEEVQRNCDKRRCSYVERKNFKTTHNYWERQRQEDHSCQENITLDPNTPLRARGFCREVHVFLADSQSTDLGEAGTVVPSGVTPDTEARTDGETA
uniref:Uncharacterized protein n=1 Tax=Solanum tuberosum TaxID=4113 RepID=M1DN11_SOLTU